MNAREADALAAQLVELIEAQRFSEACARLAPTLTQRIPFTTLGRLGKKIGQQPLPGVNAFLGQLAEARTMGGWVIIGDALHEQLERDGTGALTRCRQFALMAEVWYGVDILGERVPGYALLDNFQLALKTMSPWRVDENCWVRRLIGVGVHVWAKRTRGDAEFAEQATQLLAFLEPLFDEPEVEAIKGIGWGLKTLGRFYPTLATDWLAGQVARRPRRYRALMLNKALTYLPTRRRARIVRAAR